MEAVGTKKAVGTMCEGKLTAIGGVSSNEEASLTAQSISPTFRKIQAQSSGSLKVQAGGTMGTKTAKPQTSAFVTLANAPLAVKRTFISRLDKHKEGDVHMELSLQKIQFLKEVAIKKGEKAFAFCHGTDRIYEKINDSSLAVVNMTERQFADFRDDCLNKRGKVLNVQYGKASPSLTDSKKTPQ